MLLHPSVAQAAHWIDEREITTEDVAWDLAHLDTDRLASNIARLAQHPDHTPSAMQTREKATLNAR